MRHFQYYLLWLAAILMLNALAVPLAFAADQVCNFRGKGLTLSFGLIDPSIVQTISRPITVQITFADQAGDCVVGGNMTVSIVGSSSRQLVNGTDTINYTLTGFPVVLPRPGNAPNGNPGTGFVTWFTPGQLQGTILWSDYANAPAGSYTDSVTISVTP